MSPPARGEQPHGERAITAIQPFRGLRYDAARVRPDDVLAPPYDVVTEEEIRALRARSPYNIAHVECRTADDDPAYGPAAEALRRWQAEGVLRRDAQPAYYAYEQRFALADRTLVRRAFFARLRLHDFADGEVRPHEATMPGPRADRLALLRATLTNVSPIFGMFEDADAAVRGLLERVAARAPDCVARDDRGDDHRLWVIADAAEIALLTGAIAGSKVTIADGHHRYTTALGFAQEAGTEAMRWVLAGLIPIDDPGLVILPTHRLVRPRALPVDLLARLGTLYTVEELPGDAADPAAVGALWQRVQAAAGAGAVFGAIGLAPGRLHLLTARAPAAIDAAMPQAWSRASRALDAVILAETILEPVLGLDAAARADRTRLGYTEEPETAAREVAAGRFPLAFLVNAVPVRQVTAIADAGEVMPPKSTYFYPKLHTGLVLNPLD